MGEKQTKLKNHEELSESVNPKEIQTKKNQFQQVAINVTVGNEKKHQLNLLSYPWGIFIDNDKSIYIADSWNHRIVKWKLHSNKVKIIAENNSFIVSDETNILVIRYTDKNQTNQRIIISNIVCWGLTIDKNGYVYASDYEKHEVRRWKQGDKQGELVAGGNGRGNHLNQLNGPTFIFIDEDFSLYISDSLNHRVMKWRKDAKEGIIVAGGNGQGNSLRQLSSPQGVIVDH
ncbi:unnamed protein product, partial [Adineta steineri]